jgi:hypothetical protein
VPSAIFSGHKPIYVPSTPAGNEITKLVVDGDSIPANTYSWANTMQRWPLSNRAVAGNTIADLDGRKANIVSDRVTGAVCIISIGTNNVANGDTAAGIESALWSLIDYYWTNGWNGANNKLYVCTMFERASVGYDQTVWADVNTAIRANAASHCTGYIEQTGVIYPSTPNSTRRWLDLIHPSTIGHQYLRDALFFPLLYGIRF